MKKDKLDHISIIWVLILFYTVIFIRNAWVTEDAYITFRVVENFVNGYGMVFNIGERVQAFTHTLWFFILSGIYRLESLLVDRALFGGLYYISIFISLGFSLWSIWLVAFRLADDKKIAALCLLALSLSRAFMDYSSSGLENPASHFFIAAFVAVWFHQFESSKRRFFLLALIASLAALNRIDAVLFYLPALFIVFLQIIKKKSGLGPFLLGFLPLIVWELVSIIYYGVFIPNTAYSKLNTGIAMGMKVYQGLVYYLAAMETHPFTMFVILVGVALPFIRRNQKVIPFSIGILFYLIYILSIGGDFMAGRFLSVPFFLAVINIALHQFSNFRAIGSLAVGILLVAFIIEKPSPLSTDRFYGSTQGDDYDETLDPNGIVDEKSFYYQETGLLRVNRSYEPLASRFDENEWVRTTDDPTIIYRNSIGLVGYQRGPNYHFLDPIGLPDALLARLPMKGAHGNNWRVGHYNRVVPEGYRETILTGQNEIEDPALHEFYDHVALIIKGDIFQKGRFKAIWKLNTGQYAHLIEEYLSNQ